MKNLQAKTRKASSLNRYVFFKGLIGYYGARSESTKSGPILTRIHINGLN